MLPNSRCRMTNSWPRRRSSSLPGARCKFGPIEQHAIDKSSSIASTGSTRMSLRGPMPRMERRAPLWAASFILVLAIWGMLIDEPYFRNVGHGADAFTWARWLAIFLSAPASLLARPAARAAAANFEFEFLIEHVLWAALIVLQWRALRRGAAYLRPAWGLTLVAAAVVRISGAAALLSWHARWPIVLGGESFSWNVLDRPIGFFGLALVPAAWLWLQRRYHRSDAAPSAPRSISDRRLGWSFWLAGAPFLVLLMWLALLGAQTGSWLFGLLYRDEFRQSEVAIQAVEAFRRTHRLPPHN